MGNTAVRPVVIADDNTDLADSLGWILRAEGLETIVTYDGDQAVKAAVACRPKVVILDLAMPNMNGFEAAQKIRTALGDEVLLIAHTAWGNEETRRHALESGFNHHVVKTGSVDALIRLLVPGNDTKN